MRTGRPMTNRSNFFSEHHYRLLIMLAKQVLDYFKNTKIGRNLDINELISVGWFSQARYYKDVRGKAGRIKREMFKWAFKEYEKQQNYLCKG